MDYQSLTITIQYAEDLSKVNLISKMDVYVVVSISGGDQSLKQKTRTAVNHGGDANPSWSFPMKFTLEEAALLQDRLFLDFEIKCERALGDKVIGEVHVPVKQLLDFPAKKFVSYQVKKPGGKAKGNLTFSYQFHAKTAAPTHGHGESMIGYPVVDPIPRSPYFLAAAGTGNYSLIAPETAVVPEPASPYPAVLGLYPPILPWESVAVAPEVGGGQYPPPPEYLLAGGMAKPEWYPPPQGYFSPSPPVMQLAPDWWVVDWRYDMRCSGF